IGHSARTTRAHLRSVLFDQGHRTRHRTRPFHLLRHHARARRRNPVRQRRRPGHAFHVEAAARGLGRAQDRRPELADRTNEHMTTQRNGAILVVDDEEIMREILETLLVREGYEVRVAATGAEGLELARAVPFDAAIVDIMMPGLNGIETLDELKRIDEDLAVIIITAYASVE